MRLSRPVCCFRWRHGWLLSVWTGTSACTKPLPRCFPIGLHLFRYHRFNKTGLLVLFSHEWNFCNYLLINWISFLGNEIKMSIDPMLIFAQWHPSSHLPLAWYEIVCLWFDLSCDIYQWLLFLTAIVFASIFTLSIYNISVLLVRQFSTQQGCDGYYHHASLINADIVIRYSCYG